MCLCKKRDHDDDDDDVIEHIRLNKKNIRKIKVYWKQKFFEKNSLLLPKNKHILNKIFYHKVYKITQNIICKKKTYKLLQTHKIISIYTVHIFLSRELMSHIYFLNKNFTTRLTFKNIKSKNYKFIRTFIFEKLRWASLYQFSVFLF